MKTRKNRQIAKEGAKIKYDKIGKKRTAKNCFLLALGTENQVSIIKLLWPLELQLAIDTASPITNFLGQK